MNTYTYKHTHIHRGKQNPMSNSTKKGANSLKLLSRLQSNPLSEPAFPPLYGSSMTKSLFKCSQFRIQTP